MEDLFWSEIKCQFKGCKKNQAGCIAISLGLGDQQIRRIYSCYDHSKLSWDLAKIKDYHRLFELYDSHLLKQI